jgi:glycine/D-amino acid oxidase-like deaminating enzyme
VHALGDRAERPWAGDAFDRAVEEAQGLLPPHRRFIVDRYLNGVFAVTPDNRPLLGPCEDVGGVWFAEALWVTHAAGAAAALAAVMLGASRGAEDLSPLRPGRFAGRPAKELTARALRLYRDIYARGTPGA